jgi:hypothetical protein
MSRVL